MDELRIVVLAIIQGITEFLPISSSGHIVLFENLFGNSSNDIVLEVFLHFGTLFSILIFFKKDILDLIKGTLRRDSNSISFCIQVATATIPVIVIVLLFGDAIKSIFTVNILLYTYLINAIILFATKDKRSDKKQLSLVAVIIIGLAQTIALFPGVSRAGITICTGLLLGYNQKAVARFSFFMAIPALLGAVLFESDNIISAVSVGYMPMMLGFLFSMFTGLLALKILFQILENQKMWYFSYYCLFIWFFIVIIN